MQIIKKPKKNVHLKKCAKRPVHRRFRPSPPKIGANQFNINKLRSFFRIIKRLFFFLVIYDSSESSEQVIETIATTHSNNPLGGIEIIRMNRWDGLNDPWRLFE
jgi:hypothetical protein